jgi:AcrR family transcriptional regulator
MYLPKAERREALRAAAMRVMHRAGLSGVTTRAVAAEAQASTGIVHHHFASGEALRAEAFAELVAADMRELDAALARIGDADLAAFVVAQLVPAEGDDVRWALWCEAWDLARTDEALSGVYRAAILGLHARLAGILHRLGAAAPSAGASAWRLLAMAEGLAGFALSKPALVPTADAAQMLRAALDRELKG